MTALLRRYAIVLPIITVYVCFAVPHIGDPFTEDEAWEFYASQTLYETGTAAKFDGSINAYHPHGFYYIVGGVMQLFGVNEVGARLLGMISTILCLGLLLRMLWVLRRGHDVLAASLVSVLYLFSPVAIQGSLIITADTGVHHLILLLFLAYAVERYPYRHADYVVLPCLLAATLWIKIVTPTLVAGCFVLFPLLEGRWKATAQALAMCAGGALLFWMTWAAYSSGIGASPTEAIDYLTQVAGSRTKVPSLMAKLVATARHVITVVLWFGVPFVLLMGMCSWQFLRARDERTPRVGMLLLVGLVLLLAHTFVSGTAFGFPRYHFTMLPVWCLLFAHFGVDALRRSRMHPAVPLAAATMTFLFLALAAGDPLYAANFQLKLSQLSVPGITAPSLGSIAFTVGLWFIPATLVILLGLWQRNWLRTLALLMMVGIGSNLALDIVQVRAGYHTGIAYGESGSAEVHRYIRDSLEPGQGVVAGKDVIWHTTGRGYMMDWRWEDAEFLTGRLSDPRTGFFVMAIQHNTLAQIHRTFQDPVYQGLLSDYDLHYMGSYFLWERRPRRVAGQPGSR